MFHTLISPAELARSIDDPNWAIVDCRFDLAQPQISAQWFANSHLPHATFAHLDRDLSAPITPVSGRHPLPSPEALASTFSRFGIDASTQVIAYDQDSGAFAARLWWLLRWLGHRAVAVLDGGFAAWQREGYPVTQQIESRPSRKFVANPDPRLLIDANEAGRFAQSPMRRLLDARAPERYAGTVEPLDTAAGHVPGARNHPFGTNVNEHKMFLSPAELRARYLASLDGAVPENTAVMCGSGVTACHLLLAMEHASLSGAKLYAGSWSEWIRDPRRPIKTGAEP